MRFPAVASRTHARTREGVEAKGRRYLADGRLTITHADSRAIRATCRADGAVYTVAWDGREWRCSCPARVRCAHLVALQLVTVAQEPSG